VELHKGCFAFGIHKPECVDAEAFHEPQGTGNGPVGHDPHDHVHGFRRQGDEIPEIVMCCLGLRKAPVWCRLGRMNQVWKLDGVLNEEDRNVVAHNIPVAFFRVELHGKAPHIARKIGRALIASHSREAGEDIGLLTFSLENVCRGDVLKRIQCLEIAMRTVAAGMHDAFRNALMVEVENLFTEDEVFGQHRSARARFQMVLVVGNGHALLGGHGLVAILS